MISLIGGFGLALILSVILSVIVWFNATERTRNFQRTECVISHVMNRALDVKIRQIVCHPERSEFIRVANKLTQSKGPLHCRSSQETMRGVLRSDRDYSSKCLDSLVVV
jgi:hypothetical protein